MNLLNTRWVRLHFIASVVFGILLPCAAGAQVAPIDFLQLLRTAPDSGRSIGLQKLSSQEQAALNELLNRTYTLGRSQSGITRAPAAVDTSLRRERVLNAYMTKVDESTDRVLKLRNGAVLELPAAYLGFASYRDVVLLSGAGTCQVWIAGRRSYRCSMLRSPTLAQPRKAIETTVCEVRGMGAVVRLCNGDLYEVQSFQAYVVSIWSVGTTVLLLDGIELLNPESDGQPVSVTRIR